MSETIADTAVHHRIPRFDGNGRPLFHDAAAAHHPQNGTLLGFWLYLMSDCLIFASLFATYGIGSQLCSGPYRCRIV